MKVLTSKIVNGKKMFLIEDNNPQGKVFAQDGKPIKKENISNYNPYYVDVKGLNASESTKTNLTPATKITPQEIKKIKESPTNVGNIKIKEAQEKAQRLKEAEEAYKKRKAGAPITPESLAQETQAIGDKISLQNIPGVGQYIPDMLDVTGGLGSMASNLGALPLNLNRGNYGQAALSVAMPLGVGALAGIGNPNTGQFANNLINPFAGTGDLINKLGNKYLPNAYKLNPYAFKPNPEAFYRQVGKSAYDDAITKGKVFSKGQENMLERVPELNYLDEYNKSITLDKTGKFNLTKPSEAPFVQKGELFFPINRKPTGKGYKGTKYADAEYLLEGKLPNEAVLPRYQEKYFPTLEESSNVGVIRPEFNELNNFNVYKRDWLKGYKEVPKELPGSSNATKKFGLSIDELGTKGIVNKNVKEEITHPFGKNSSPYLRTGQVEYENGLKLKTYSDVKTKEPNLISIENPKTGETISYTRKTTLDDNWKPAYSNEWSIKADMSSADKDLIKFANKELEKIIPVKPIKTESSTISTDGLRYWDQQQKHGYSTIDKFTTPQVSAAGKDDLFKGLNYKSMTDDSFGAAEFATKKDATEGAARLENFMKSQGLDYKVIVTNNNTLQINLPKLQRAFSMGGMITPPAAIIGAGAYMQNKEYKNGGAIGNNGMFDMTNPNIYKTLVGGLAIGTLGKQAMENKEFGGKILDTKIENGKKYYLINE